MLMALAQSLSETGLHAWIQTQPWLWPVLEISHFIGLTLLIGGLIVVDFRVLGFGAGSQGEDSLQSAYQLLSLVLAGFALNLITGVLFCFGDPFRYAANIGFRWKMFLIFVAGVNALYHHWRLSPTVAGEESLSTEARISAALSLCLWTAVILLGRLIPYVGTG